MRAPDQTVDAGNGVQMLRWHLWLPKFLLRRGWQLALHKWLQSDHDRALHDHKSWNVSVLLTGRYREWFFHPLTDPSVLGWVRIPFRYIAKMRLPFVPYFRRAETPHRIELLGGPIWTLWLRGPARREWGFWTPNGWVHWERYTSYDDSGNFVIRHPQVTGKRGS